MKEQRAANRHPNERPIDMSDTKERDITGALLRGLAHPTRLCLLAAIVENPRSPQELSSILKIDIANAVHHLRKLERAGLAISSPDFTTDEFTIRYRADFSQLQQLAIQLSTPTRVRETASVANVDSNTLDVLSTFFDGPHLKALPVRGRKRELVLEEILRRIPKRQEYLESELNGFIEPIFEDFCTVRREWVDRRYMARNRGVYRWAERGIAVLSGVPLTGLA